MQENKSPVNDKEKGFALLRPDTIQLWVWLQGYQPLDEQPLKSLSEDISYRIRETSDCAVNFMRHCKRSTLKTSDLNQAFQQCNIERNFGNNSTNVPKYNVINTSETNNKVLKCFRTKLFELNDEIIPLRLPEEPGKSQTRECEPRDKKIYGKWILVNGNTTHLESKEFDNCEFNLEEFDYNSKFDIESELFYASSLDEPSKKFYDLVTGIILLQFEKMESHSKLFNRILESLRVERNFQPLLPYIINFISRTIHILTLVSNNPSSIISKTNIFYLERAVLTLKNMILNNNLFLAPKGFFSRILSCLLYCTLQNTTFVKNIEGLRLRENASYTMVLFLKLYQRFSTNTVQYLNEKFFMPHFSENYENTSQLFTTYGIIVSLIYFGGQIIDTFYQTLIKFATRLNYRIEPKFISDIEVHVFKILLKCFVVYYKWLSKKNYFNKENRCYKRLLIVYTEIENLFGDAFTNQVFYFKINQIRKKIPIKVSQNFAEYELLRRNYSFKELSYKKDDKAYSYSDFFEESKMINRNSKIKISYGTQKTDLPVLNKKRVEILPGKINAKSIIVSKRLGNLNSESYFNYFNLQTMIL